MPKIKHPRHLSTLPDSHRKEGPTQITLFVHAFRMRKILLDCSNLCHMTGLLVAEAMMRTMASLVGVNKDTQFTVSITL